MENALSALEAPTLSMIMITSENNLNGLNFYIDAKLALPMLCALVALQ